MLSPASCPLRSALPRFSLPLRHFALAAACFWAFAFALFLGRDRLMGFELDARWALGCVHLLTLGWLSATLLGALSQMLPAHTVEALRRPWAPALGFWLLALGLAAFVGEIWTGGERYWRGAALAGTALALYLSSYAPTLAAAPRLAFTERHFAAALAFLAALGLLGGLLAFDRQRGLILPDPDGALIAHVHLALVGWITLSILGASYRLFGPAAMARAENRGASRAAFALLAGATLGLSADALWFGLEWARLWAILLAAGYLAYLSQLRQLPRGGWKLDIPTAFAFLGLAGGLAWTVLGLALAFGFIKDAWEARAAYGLCALLGWATPWVLGQSHKIFPFLVWRSAYGQRPDAPSFDVVVGRPALAWGALLCLALGWPLSAVGLLLESQSALSAGLALVLACASAYALQSGLWLSHLAR